MKSLYPLVMVILLLVGCAARQGAVQQLKAGNIASDSPKSTILLVHEDSKMSVGNKAWVSCLRVR